MITFLNSIFISFIFFQIFPIAISWKILSKPKLQSSTALYIRLSKKAIYERLIKNTLRPKDLDESFQLSKVEEEYSRRCGSINGKYGVIINVEGALLDCTDLYYEGFKKLQADQQLDLFITYDKIKASRGLPFRDSLGILCRSQIELYGPEINQYEMRFYEILLDLAKKIPVKQKENSSAIIESIAENSNSIVLISHLPQSIFLSVIQQLPIFETFKKYIPFSNVLTLSYFDDLSEEVKSTEKIQFDPFLTFLFTTYEPRCGEKYLSRRLLHACYLLEKPSYMTVYLDENYLNVNIAKKANYPSIGIKGKLLPNFIS